MSPRIAAVIPARNEEKFIGNTLHSLLSEQETKPTPVIVVDDGSHDNTSQVALNFGAEVIRLPDRGYPIQGTPILADVMNQGLQRLNDYGFGEKDDDYVMILGADHLLPSNYISTIIAEMEKNKNIAICSGIIEGEEKKNLVPRGSGRIVRVEFWKKIGLHYPVKFGFEGYLVVKALQMGYTNMVLDQLITTTQRRTGQNYGKKAYIGYGKGIKALGYSRLYTAGKIGLVFVKNPKRAIYMLRGYLSDVEVYDKEFREYIRNMQYKQIKQYLLGSSRLLS